MHVVFIILFGITGFAFGAVSHQNERFFRLLRMGINPVYDLRDRDLVADADYASHLSVDTSAIRGIDSSRDGTQEFSRNFNGSTGVEMERFRSDSLRERHGFFSAHLSGASNHTANTRFNSIIDRGDTTDNLTTAISFSALGGRTNTRFWERRRRPGKYRLLEADIKIHLQADRNHYNTYINHKLEGTTSYTNTETFNRGLAEGTVSGFAGYGRPRPVTPLYRAMQIERLLLKQSALKNELSDSTVIMIAEWLSGSTAWENTLDQPDQYFYHELFEILKHDSATVNTVSDCATAFEIRDLVNRSYPVVYNGFVAGLRFSQEIIFMMRESYGKTNGIFYESEMGPDFSQRNFFGWEAWYRKSLSWRWNLAIGTGSNFVSNGSPDLFQEFWLLAWNASTTFWLTDALIAQAWMTNLEAFIVVPRSQPQVLGAGLNYFINDNILINLTLEKTCLSGSLHSLSSQYDEHISLGMRYDF